jgi:hypothetical protein
MSPDEASPIRAGFWAMSASVRLKHCLRDAPASGACVPDVGVPDGEDEDGHRVEMSRKTPRQTLAFPVGYAVGVMPTLCLDQRRRYSGTSRVPEPRA